MINPIDNASQISAEDDVIALWQDERILAAREHVERLWRNAWADRIPEESAAGVASAIDEYVTNWHPNDRFCSTQNKKNGCKNCFFMLPCSLHC